MTDKTKIKIEPDPTAGSLAYWLICPWGALYPASVPAHVGGPDVLQVRARQAEFIDRFRKLYCESMQPTVATKDRDYQFRALCDRKALANAVAQMTLDIDSEKMKPTAFGKLGVGGQLASDYHAVLNRMWSVMLDLGEGKGWSGSKLAPADPQAPEGSRCVLEGHIWPARNGSRSVVCPDCGSRKSFRDGGKITYPKRKVAR